MQDLSNVVITPEKVRKKLIKLNPSKSPGHDNWHPYFLRELANTLSVPLPIIFNKSQNEGAHKSWRKAVITATYKNGQIIQSGNYRPVSLASVISKIMESLMRRNSRTHAQIIVRCSTGICARKGLHYSAAIVLGRMDRNDGNRRDV